MRGVRSGDNARHLHRKPVRRTMVVHTVPPIPATTGLAARFAALTQRIETLEQRLDAIDAL